MKEYAAYCLKPGTILDGRYQISRVIGIGGFGITYEAVNERIHLRVAIKEFFCRETVYRDADRTVRVASTDGQAVQDFEAAKKKFLREARLVGDFASQPGIVDVIDYFEENGTAYMVMNYLDGVTLGQFVKEHGRFETEKLVRLFLPLLHTLEKVHSGGIIHRDISPDNIMVLKDGTVKLLDFGAARDFMQNKTQSITLKGGYAPQEQYDEHGKQGPWTDVYALCATMYECLTGQRPVSSVARVLHDDLKMPSELGIKIDGAFEKILKKGLKVKAEDRYQTVGELIAVLEVWLPKPEKKKKHVGLAIAGTMFLCAIIAAGIGGYAYYRANIEKFMFRGMETETVVLVPDASTTAKEYAADVETIEKRVKTMVGDEPYLVKEENGKIRIETSLAAYRKYNSARLIEDMVQQYVASPGQLYMGLLAENKDGGQISIYYHEMEKEDISSWTVKEGQIPIENNVPFGEYERYIEFTVSEDTEDYIRETLSDISEDCNVQLRLFADVNSDYEYKYGLVGNESCDTFYMAINNRETWRNIFEYPEISAPFEIYEEISAEWEEEFIGENQCLESEISLPAVVLEFGDIWDEDAAEEDEDAALLREETIFRIRERMDLLGIPYAWGTSTDGRKRIIIKTAQKDMNLFLAKVLVSEYTEMRFSNGETFYDQTIKADEIQAVENEDGTFCFQLKISEYLQEELKKFISEMDTEERKNLVLTYLGCSIAKIDLDELLENGTIHCLENLMGETSEFTEESLVFFELLDTIFHQDYLWKNYSLKNVQYISKEEKVAVEAQEQNEILNASHTMFEDIQNIILKEYPNAEAEEQLYLPDGSKLFVTLHMGDDGEAMAHALKAAGNIFEMCSLQNQEFYSKIGFYIDYSGEGRYISFSRDYETGEWEVYLSCLDEDSTKCAQEFLENDTYYSKFEVEL